MPPKTIELTITIHWLIRPSRWLPIGVVRYGNTLMIALPFSLPKFDFRLWRLHLYGGRFVDYEDCNTD